MRLCWCIVAVAIIVAAILIGVFFLRGQYMQDYCTSFNLTECPQGCVVCPPCVVCSSISCNSAD